MPYWNEPKYNEPEDVESPEDVELPQTLHFMQARAEVNCLMEEGVLSAKEGDELLAAWQARGRVSGEDEVEAAIDILEDRGLLEESEADDLRAEAPAQ